LLAVNEGGSLTGLTVMVMLCAALVLALGGVLLPLSVSVTRKVAEPKLSAAARYVRLPVVTSMAGACVKVRAVSGPVRSTLKATSVWPAAASSGGPTLRFVAKPLTVTGPASSLLLVELDGRVKLGGSLMGLTVMVKVWAALVLEFGGVLLPLSVRVTLNVAEPLAFGAAW